MDITINGTLTLDQTSGLQDDDDTIASTLAELSDRFEKFLNRTASGSDPNLQVDLALDAGQLAYAATARAVISDTSFVTVSAASTENVSDLFFSDADGNLLAGNQVFINGDPLGDPLQTVGGQNIYLHSYDNGNIVVATTDPDAGEGEVVAAFYLNEAVDHKSAGVEMVTFIPIAHPDPSVSDESIDWTDLLNVSATGSVSFDFDNLESGNFLWVAIGNENSGLLVTGQDLNVVDTGNKAGNMVKGGSDSSDSVNTSQGGINATIGINAQHFTDGPKVNGSDTDGPVAVFTLVNGYVPLANNALDQATGGNVNQIDYDGYVDTGSVDIFISQTTSNGDAKMKISLVNASLVSGTPEEKQGGANPYIGNDTLDTALKNDAAVDVGSVTIDGFTWNWNDAGIGAGITQGAGANAITVSINGNVLIVDGVTTADTITVSAKSGTFNRFDVQGMAGTADFDIGRIDIDNVTGDTAGVGGSLIVDDDGPKIGDSDGVSAAIADSVVELTTGAAGTVTDVTLGGAVGTDTKSSPYTLVDYTGYDGSIISINSVELKAVPNNTTASLVTGVTYYEDTNGNNTFGDAGDDAYYSLTLNQTANSDAGGYTFQVLKTPPPGTLDFSFDNLESGIFLWVAIGSEAAGLLVSGQDLNVVETGTKAGNMVKGGSDPSDSMNTSQGGIGATIGVNAQHFTDGPKVNGQNTDGAVCVFTLTTGFAPLPTTGDGQATGGNVNQIDYNNYLDTPSAELFISQTVGNGDAIMKISLLNASLVGGTPEEKQGGANPYIGNDTNDTALKNDAEVNVGSVTVHGFTWNWDDANIATGVTQGTGANAITVSINGNDITVEGATTGDTVEFTARTGTFNRFTLQGLADSADFDVGKVSLGFDLDTPDQLFEFTAKVTDGDADSALACWQVGIDGTGANDNGVDLSETCTPVDNTVSALALPLSSGSMLSVLGTSGHTLHHHHEFLSI